MSATNKEIVEKVNASFAAGGVEGFLSHCADDVVWTIVGEKTVNGKNAIREWMASMDIEPPKFTVNNIIAEGDFVAINGAVFLDLDDQVGVGKPDPVALRRAVERGVGFACDVRHLRPPAFP